MHDVTAQIVLLADNYAAFCGLRVTTVSARCSGQAHTINRVRNGGNITIRRAAHIQQWLSDRWPADLAWPDGIDRPAPSPESPAAAFVEERQDAENGDGSPSGGGGDFSADPRRSPATSSPSPPAGIGTHPMAQVKRRWSASAPL